MEGSLVAYKVFTNGSVLNASEINDNLMNQSVMVFSNSTARSAAITAPLEGMLTWLEDVNRYEFYNGTAWVSNNTGMVQLATQSFVAVNSVSFNTLFSSLYRDYFFLFSGNHTTTSADVFFRLRQGITDYTATNYFSGSVTITDAAGPTRAYLSNQQQSAVANVQGIASNFGFTISEPFTADEKSAFSQSTAIGGTGAVFRNSWGFLNFGQSFDGITFFLGAGNFTGTITAYGYRR
jgi:hypothetical protein